MPGSGPNEVFDGSDSDRLPAARTLRRVGGVLLLALVVLSPWPIACNEPAFELILGAGILTLVGLWIAYSTLVDRFTFRLDVVSLCLAGLILWTAVQLIPLPEFVVGLIAPSRLDWHRDLQPTLSEMLPGSLTTTPRSTFLPLTVDTSVTRTFLARVLGLLLLYAVVRNWLATRNSLTMLAWAMAINGVVLAFIAILQYYSGPQNLILWTFPVDNNAIFGPFVCRNHYPDYANFCLGFTIALLLTRRARTPDDHAPNQDGSWQTARFLALVTAVGFLFVSVAFSLSRGGLVATIAATVLTWLITRFGEGSERKSAGHTNPTRFALAGAVAVGVVVMAWLGSDAIEKRFGSLGGNEGFIARLPLWRNGLRTLPATWSTGSGAGTFTWTEPIGRITNGSIFYYDSAHNEYLEALLEGGVIRLGLTLVLAFGTLNVIGRGYLERRDRSVGPMLLGIGFGLAALVLHSVVDFGIHMPAIAVTAAIVAGFGMAAAVDPSFVPQRIRVRKLRSGDATAIVVPPDVAIELTKPDNPSWVVTGPMIVLLGLFLGAAAIMVTLEVRGRVRSDRLQVQAEAAFWNLNDPDRFARRAELLELRANDRPDDTTALIDAAQGHVDAAVAATWAPGAGVVGGAMGFAQPPLTMNPIVIDRHLVPALRFLQAARAGNPLSAKAHARLAVYAQYCVQSEPAAVHFARAKRLLPTDPDLWYYAGREAFRRGDEAAAQADWQHSLSLSSQHLKAILHELRGRLSPEQLRANLLPDDPLLLIATVEELFPDRNTQAAQRRPFLDRVLELTRGRSVITIDQLVARAGVLDELDRTDEVYDVWVKAVTADSDRVDVRDRFSRWLEKEERYEEAIPHIEWLRQRSPNNGNLQDRYAAARHARRLGIEINKD